MKTDKDYITFIIYGMVKADEFIYFYNYVFGCLVKVNATTGDSQILWLDQSRNFLFSDMYGGIRLDADQVIIAPRCADDILIYDMNECTMKFFSYNATPLWSEHKANQFVSVQIYKDYYYFFPGRNDEIIKMNKYTHEFIYIRGWANEVGKMPNPGSVKFNNAIRVRDNICLLPCFQKGLVMEFDMETDSWKIHMIYDDALADIAFDGESCWVAVKNMKNILKWEWSPDDSGDIEVYSCPQDNDNQEMGFVHIVAGNNDVFAIPFYGNQIYRLNKKSLEIDRIKYRSETKCLEDLRDFNPSGVNTFCCLQQSIQEAYIYDALSGDILRLDTDSGDISRIKISLSQGDQDMIRNTMVRMKFDSINYESEDRTISDFIEYVMIQDEGQGYA